MTSGARGGGDWNRQCQALGGVRTDDRAGLRCQGVAVWKAWLLCLGFSAHNQRNNENIPLDNEGSAVAAPAPKCFQSCSW